VCFGASRTDTLKETTHGQGRLKGGFWGTKKLEIL